MLALKLTVDGLEQEKHTTFNSLYFIDTTMTPCMILRNMAGYVHDEAEAGSLTNTLQYVQHIYLLIYICHLWNRSDKTRTMIVFNS